MPRQKKKSHIEPNAKPTSEAPKESQNELIKAIEKEDLEEAKRLLNDADYVEKNYSDIDGMTLLRSIGKIKDEQLRNQFLKILVNAGIDAEFCKYKPENYSGFTFRKRAFEYRFVDNLASWLLIKPSLNIKFLAALALQILVAIFLPQYCLLVTTLVLAQLCLGAAYYSSAYARDAYISKLLDDSYQFSSSKQSSEPNSIGKAPKVITPQFAGTKEAAKSASKDAKTPSKHVSKATPSQEQAETIDRKKTLRSFKSN